MTIWSLGAAFGLLGCSGEGAVPAELVGYWTTSEARYEGRAFALSDSTLTIVRGPGDASVYEIISATRETEGGAFGSWPMLFAAAA